MRAVRLGEPNGLSEIGLHQHRDRRVLRVLRIELQQSVLWKRVDAADHLKPRKDVVRAGVQRVCHQQIQVLRHELVVVIEKCRPLRLYHVERSLSVYRGALLRVVGRDRDRGGGQHLILHGAHRANQQITTDRDVRYRYRHSIHYHLHLPVSVGFYQDCMIKCAAR